MTPKEISALLAEDTETVLQRLLPNGRREGNHWVVGSAEGEEGKSTKVTMRGRFAGKWKDFATGEHGDLIDLWRISNGIPVADAMRQAADFLGVELSDKRPAFVARERKYAKPTTVLTPAPQQSPVTEYLTRVRKLSQDTIDAFHVGQSPKGAIFFPFYDPAGELVMVKWRSIEAKKIGVTEKDMRPCLFGWQAVPPGSRAIVICEGEFDAMAFREFGIAALSVPFGGGVGAKQDWIEHEFENLDRFDEIYIAMDMDEEGQKASSEILSRLGRHRCKIVRLPHKDANECLLKGVTDDQMWACLRDAETQDPTELRNAGSYRDEVLREFNKTDDERGFGTPWDKAKTLRFRPGEVTVIAGINGHGKSEAVGHFVIDAIAQGEKACVASMEFKPRRFLHNVVRQASAVGSPTDAYILKILDWIQDSLWVFDVSTTAMTDRLLEVFTYARQRYGVSLFVVDNMSKMDVDIDKNEPQRQFMAKLTDFAKDNDVHVFLVAHQKKGEDEYKPTGKMDVKGSGAITDLADTVLIWHRNKAKEDKLKRPDITPEEKNELSDKYDAICRCVKQRNGEDEPVILLWWHAPSHQFLSTPGGRPIEYVPI